MSSLQVRIYAFNALGWDYSESYYLAIGCLPLMLGYVSTSVSYY
jgi:uncharacterized membrane protein